MKSTEKSKNLIAEAVRNLPDDFALAETRAYLLHAYNELERVENKRDKRENKKPEKGFAPVAQSKETKEATPWTPQQVLDVVNHIDQQIAEAKKELDEIHKQRSKGTDELLED